VQCDIQPDDTVAIWGCGPVGQMAIRSAVLLGAKRVIAIDRVPERLSMAQAGGAEVLNFEEVNVVEALNDDGRHARQAGVALRFDGNLDGEHRYGEGQLATVCSVSPFLVGPFIGTSAASGAVG